MKSNHKVFAADLFCGAGGSSSGLLKAVKKLGWNVELLAINHWDIAIATHSLNHPGVKHINSDLEKVDPRLVVPGGKLDLLFASPECTHFSKARGGKPMSKQSRASVKYILRWVTALEVKNVIIENVSEFQDWGPLHRTCNCGAGIEAEKHQKKCHFQKPIQNRKGEYFHRFIRKMKDHGYIVKYRVLNAADYGDPTTRKRLFVLARKGGSPVFPEPTHAKQATDMFGTRPTWRPARDIIDWSIKGVSIFQRKTPLAENTMRRIMAGIRKFGGKAFVIGQQSGAVARDVDQPIPTIAGAGAISFIEPFLVTTNWTATNRSQPRSVDDPIPAITGQGQVGLVQPFLVEYHNGKGSERRTCSVDEPLPTVTSTPHVGLIEPFIMPVNHGKNDHRAYSMNDPMPTVTSVDAWALVDPFLVEYYGTGSASSVDEPLKTQTSRDRFGLVQPMVFEQKDRKFLLDIRFRMLQPHELARAMSFPKNYKFSGNREQVVKQIGNAVPVELAAALCGALFSL
jgi:DNA (cytosine-5)-methyltransferase 1